MVSISNHNNLTEEEADLYDRQIRLWGLESQKRLRSSSILLIGLHGLGAEFCKNIVLSGIKTITLLDEKDSNVDDTFCQFLIPRENIGTNRAEASLERAKNLNPMVEVLVDKEGVDKKPDEYFTSFNVVVATGCNLQQLLRINRICHEANVKFYCGDVFGFFGYFFADLQTQEYVDEKMSGKESENFKDEIHYPTLEKSLGVTSDELKKRSKRALADFDSFFMLRVLFEFQSKVGRNPQRITLAEDLEVLKKLRDSEWEKYKSSTEKVPDTFLEKVLFSQVSPVCAIVGGELAQEVIKTLSRKGEPHNNFFFFNPIKNHGIIIKLGHLTEDEPDSIQLCGLVSKKLLRPSSILLIGLHGLGAGFFKNIVHFGIKTITLLDEKDSNVDTFCQFLIPREKIGTNRAEAILEHVKNLNPMVEVLVDTEGVDKKPDEYFTNFNVVVATGCNLQQLLRINRICHEANVKFYCGDVFGFFGYFFADLQTHEYVDEKMSKGKEPEKIKDEIHYPTLEESLVVTSDELKKRSKWALADFHSFFMLKVLFEFQSKVGRNPQTITLAEDLEVLKQIRDSEWEKYKSSTEKVPDYLLEKVLFSKVSPVCAILGAELAQEVIKALSRKGEPHNNFFFFNPTKNHGIIIKLGQ